MPDPLIWTGLPEYTTSTIRCSRPGCTAVIRRHMPSALGLAVMDERLCDIAVAEGWLVDRHPAVPEEAEDYCPEHRP